MTDFSPRLEVPLLENDQDSAETQVNEALFRIDSIANSILILDRDLTAPPGSESSGDVYLVGAGATGSWAGQDGRLAIFHDGGYIANEDGDFPTPKEGMFARIQDEAIIMYYTGTAWQQIYPSPKSEIFNAAAVAWNNMPLAATELYGVTVNRRVFSSKSYTQFRLTARLTSAVGAAAAVIRLQYSTDEAAWNNAEAAAVADLSIAGSTNDNKIGAWASLVSGAIADDLHWRIQGQGGDGVADPVFAFITAEFR